jgi:hypothetical protein
MNFFRGYEEEYRTDEKFIHAIFLQSYDFSLGKIKTAVEKIFLKREQVMDFNTTIT